MNLVQRYAFAVGKHLPAKQRPDIQAEIQSMIQDMLDERSRQSGRPVDEPMINAVLKELGDPEKLAASYLPERYLIGPKLYPTFILILRIVAIVLSTLAVVGLGIRIAGGDLSPQSVVRTVLDSLAGYFGGAMLAFGMIVLNFAFLERVLPASEFEKEESADWDPARLMDEPDPDHVSVWEPITTIVFTVAGLLILNFYPQLLGINFPQDGGWVSIPIMSEAFFRLLPLMNIAGGLTILVHLILFRQGRWQTSTRWLSLLQQLLSLVITIMFLTGPTIFDLGTASQASGAIPEDVAALLTRILSPAARLALTIALLAGAFDIVKTLRRLVAGRDRAVAVPTK